MPGSRARSENGDRKWPQELQDHAGDGIGNGIANYRDWIPGPLLHSVDRRCTGRLSGNRTTEKGWLHPKQRLMPRDR